MTARPSPQPPLEDYALLADRHTGPLVSRAGSIDWLCLPRFDDDAVFAAILGTPENGRWLVAPVDGEVVHRAYVGDTFVLETLWRTPTGDVLCRDFMPDNADRNDVIRSAECLTGEVVIHQELVMRFGYGENLPWVRRVRGPEGERLVAIAGPDALCLDGPLPHAVDGHHVGDVTLRAGDEVHWNLTWFPSYHPLPEVLDPGPELASTLVNWQQWSASIQLEGYPPAVRRSLLVLRALTHHDTGGIAAAPTTSLPEEWGGERNWDYRFCWLRDSALTIEAMANHGAAHGQWRNWLLRAIAGDHDRMRIMYGLGGERLGPETTLQHLPGYADSRPVRVGNGAADQYQADVVGEVMISLCRIREIGVTEDRFSWALQRALLRFAEERFDQPDHGIWEVRGPARYFTHSRVMMWAAFDRGIQAVENYGLKGPVDTWRALRDRLRTEIESNGWNADLNSFTQAYGATTVDAALLALPQTGFIAWDDPRMLGTVARIEADLMTPSGLLLRYHTAETDDGVAGDEHTFLLCSFWLVAQYAHTGRLEEARRLFDQLLSYRSDVGLLSEEYDVATGRLSGNYPQAFSHLGLVQAADALRRAEGRIGHGSDER